MSRTPCLAHYGTTLAEAPIPDDELATAPLTGQVAETHRFLDLLGFEPLVTNLYPGLGRQWIRRRGRRGEPGYVEKDSFSSFTAVHRPPTDDGRPRVGDAVFRLPERDPSRMLARLVDEGLARPYLGVLDEWFLGPDEQAYELAPVSDDPAANRVISIWTDPATVERISGRYAELFGFAVVDRDAAVGDGRARAHVLRREDRGACTIRLLVPADGSAPAPRWTEDIFAEVGYPHFRLGAPSRSAVKAVAPEVFPDTGDVSYVLFEHAYLELVELA